MMIRPQLRNTRAFTLIELLVTLGIVATLSALLFAAIGPSRDQADRTGCASNLRSIYLALSSYATDNNGFLPPQVDDNSGRDWSGQLVDGNYVSEAAFTCPADRDGRAVDGTPRSYAINSGKWTFRLNGYQSPWPASPYDPPKKLSIIPATVMLVGENHGTNGLLPSSASVAVVGIPAFEGLDALATNTHGEKGSNYVFADGHVEFLSESEMSTFRADTDYAGDRRDPWKWKN